jgi:hypothetical protein
MGNQKIIDDLREALRTSSVPLGARAQLEQLHAAFFETCKEQGVTLDDNALAAAIVALSAAESMRDTLVDGSPMVATVVQMHDAMVNIYGLTPSRYLLSALVSSPAPE